MSEPDRQRPVPAAAARASSWPPLLIASAVFLVGFWWLRSRSELLAIEARRPAAVALEQRHGLPLADLFALRDLLGPATSDQQWDDAARDFRRLQAELGPGLAAVALAGAAEVAQRARAAADSADAAWQRFRSEPAALPGLRFLQLRERFATRAAARD